MAFYKNLFRKGALTRRPQYTGKEAAAIRKGVAFGKKVSLPIMGFTGKAAKSIAQFARAAEIDVLAGKAARAGGRIKIPKGIPKEAAREFKALVRYFKSRIK